MSKKIISIFVILLLVSCNNTNTEKDVIREKIEQAIKSNSFLKDSRLRNFEYEIIHIKIEDFFGNTLLERNLRSNKLLLQEAIQYKEGVRIENGFLTDWARENIDYFFESTARAIDRQKINLSLMKALFTDKKYKVISRGYVFEGRLRTYFHIYLNDRFEIIHFYW